MATCCYEEAQSDALVSGAGEEDGMNVEPWWFFVSVSCKDWTKLAARSRLDAGETCDTVDGMR